jgi:hypothetical protein
MLANSRRSAGVLLFVAIVVCTRVMCQETGSFEELTLEIATSARGILPMEPMPITITLCNNTERSIKGHTMIHPGIGLLHIYAAKGNQSFQEFHSSDWVTWAIEREGDVFLKPGFRKSVSGYLFYAHPANLDKESAHCRSQTAKGAGCCRLPVLKESAR